MVIGRVITKADCRSIAFTLTKRYAISNVGVDAQRADGSAPI